MLANTEYHASVLEMGNVRAAATKLGYQFVSLEIQRAEDIEPSFEGLRERADALYVCGADPLVNTNRVRINALALGAHLPICRNWRFASVSTATTSVAIGE